MNKVTYLIGAGSSANALPVVNGLTDRFKFFCWHYQEYVNNNGGEPSNEIAKRATLIRNIESHQTVDTYAKKLYLQNKDLAGNSEYQYLINHLSAFFIYEQLKKNVHEPCNLPLKMGKTIEGLIGFESAWVEGFELNYEREIKNKILKEFDTRYDSFFASVLQHDDDGNIVMPDEISIVSWNYDSQFEKAFMNFANVSYDTALERLNFVGLKDGENLQEGKSAFIKLNGTAAFYRDGYSFGDLFDYGKHNVNEDTFKIWKSLLSAPRTEHNNSLRFAWVQNDASMYAINAARKVMQESDIIVVIGYSFPYFNRIVDREIFSNVKLEKKGRVITKQKYQKMYIQGHESDINSVVKRFDSIIPNAVLETTTEIDQFLIPNEL